MNDNNRKIPHYINDPIINKLTAPENELYRPEIDFFKARLKTMIFCVICLVVAILVTFIYIKFGYYSARINNLYILAKAYICVIGISIICCSKYIMIWFIRVYQRYARSETRLRCCFKPSCSEYAILALKKYGAIVATIKIINRLLSCKPPGGIDYP